MLKNKGLADTPAFIAWISYYMRREAEQLSKHIISTTDPNYKNVSIPPSKSPLKSLTFKNILSKNKRAFTLIELIVVIIIVGILAAVGMTQYTLIVEKARTAEAKVRIGAMRTLAYNYYLENGTLTGMQNADVGVDYTCASTDFYRYAIGTNVGTYADLVARRCTGGGKTPNASRAFYYYMVYYPGTGLSVWRCHYIDDSSPCFGLTP